MKYIVLSYVDIIQKKIRDMKCEACQTKVKAESRDGPYTSTIT